MEVVVIFILIALITSILKRQADSEGKEFIEGLKIRHCPPHAWKWEDIETPEGDIQGSRIVCERCGPLSKSIGDGEV